MKHWWLVAGLEAQTCWGSFKQLLFTENKTGWKRANHGCPSLREQWLYPKKSISFLFLSVCYLSKLDMHVRFVLIIQFQQGSIWSPNIESTGKWIWVQANGPFQTIIFRMDTHSFFLHLCVIPLWLHSQTRPCQEVCISYNQKGSSDLVFTFICAQ